MLPRKRGDRDRSASGRARGKDEGRAGAGPDTGSPKSQGEVYLAGDLENFDLTSVTQLLLFSRKSGALEIVADDRTAHVYFDNGQIVHAASGNELGEDAFFHVFRIDAGRFHFDADVSAPARTIDKGSTHLLMEAVRRADERGSDGKTAVLFAEPKEPVPENPPHPGGRSAPEESLLATLAAAEDLTGYALFEGDTLLDAARPDAAEELGAFEALLSERGGAAFWEAISPARPLAGAAGAAGLLAAGGLQMMLLDAGDGRREVTFRKGKFTVLARLRPGVNPRAVAVRLYRG